MSDSPKKDSSVKKSSKKFIKCKLCTKIVTTTSYQEHLTKTHEIRDKFEDLDLHSISPAKQFHKCDECSEEFLDVELLKTHMSNHLPPKTSKRQFRCEKCYKRFRAERYLKMHHRMNKKCKTVSVDAIETGDSKREEPKANDREVVARSSEIAESENGQAGYIDTPLPEKIQDNPGSHSKCDKPFVNPLAESLRSKETELQKFFESSADLVATKGKEMSLLLAEVDQVEEEKHKMEKSLLKLML